MNIEITIDAKHSLSAREAQMLQALLHTYKMVLLQSVTLEKLISAISSRGKKPADEKATEEALRASIAAEIRRFTEGYFPDLGFSINVTSMTPKEPT